jgi:hypothetical protein
MMLSIGLGIFDPISYFAIAIGKQGGEDEARVRDASPKDHSVKLVHIEKQRL